MDRDRVKGIVDKKTNLLEYIANNQEIPSGKVLMFLCEVEYLINQIAMQEGWTDF